MLIPSSKASALVGGLGESWRLTWVFSDERRDTEIRAEGHERVWLTQKPVSGTGDGLRFSLGAFNSGHGGCSD